VALLSSTHLILPPQGNLWVNLMVALSVSLIYKGFWGINMRIEFDPQISLPKIGENIAQTLIN
jgi:hypothetical protein